jgi:hypothetical protein
MSLSATNRAIIESWTGTLQEEDEDTVEAALSRLGAAAVVALEILSRRLSEFAMNSADVGSGNDRANHASNFRWLILQRDRLVGSITEQVAAGDLTLSVAAEQVVAALSVTGDYTRPVLFNWSVPRRA